MFFGREDDFLFVTRKISEGKSNQIIILCGERRSGKTSILFQILTGRLGPNFLPILIDMQILAGIKSDYDFFKSILKVACQGLNSEDITVEMLMESDKNTVESLFESFLKLIETRFPEKILLFLLDEYELIEAKIRDGSLSLSTIHYLAGILESPYKVSFIFTGSTNLENRKVDYWKSLLGKSIYKKISTLSFNDTARLIKEPLKDFIEYPDEVISRIFRLTGGQPFYTQVVCQNIVDILVEEERNDVKNKDLDHVAGDIVANPLPQMIYFWDSLSDEVKLVLSCLGSLLKKPDEWTSASRIRQFLKKEKIRLPLNREKINIFVEEAYHNEFLVKNAELNYQFRMDLYRRWIKKEHSIWKVLKEVDIKLKPASKKALIITAASIVVILLAAGALLFLPVGKNGFPGIFNFNGGSVKPTADEVKDYAITANTGPFRVVVDGSLSLTNEGLKDEKTILIPSLKTGEHAFEFLNPETGEKISLQAVVSMENKGLGVEFTRKVVAESSNSDSSQKTQIASKTNKGSLFIVTKPQGAQILLDGDPAGVSPLNLEGLKAGKHSLELILPGYRHEKMTVTVEGDKVTPKTVDLIETFGYLQLDVRPRASIYMDGVHLADTPYVKPVKVPTGNHEIQIVNESLNFNKKIWVEVLEEDTVKIVEIIE
ncbi:MAG: PEGA domain-containing protein [Spirochaetales bacterium]|nr:PEGA domain-containing protein [Spirochaetales bacterium]